MMISVRRPKDTLPRLEAHRFETSRQRCPQDRILQADNLCSAACSASGRMQQPWQWRSRKTGEHSLKVRDSDGERRFQDDTTTRLTPVSTFDYSLPRQTAIGFARLTSWGVKPCRDPPGKCPPGARE
jgi:hypothetical protein